MEDAATVVTLREDLPGQAVQPAGVRSDPARL